MPAKSTEGSVLACQLRSIPALRGRTKPGSRKKQTFTLMIVPHSGHAFIRQLHVSMAVVKGIGIAVLVVLVTSLILVFNYRGAMLQAQAERAELMRLRSINSEQAGQINQLAQITLILQQDMKRLNNLDAELRKMVDIDADTTQVSRSGAPRPTVTNPDGPQGGPESRPNLQELTNNIKNLQREIAVREESLKRLKNAIAERQARLAVTPSIWPTNGEITSGFGYRRSPWGWGRVYHSGVDVAAEYGSPIYATADGVVTYSGWMGGYGKVIIIDHGNEFNTYYGHCSRIYVGVGEYVTKGQVIGAVGSTGASTGPHVHYEVRVYGNPVNPIDYM